MKKQSVILALLFVLISTFTYAASINFMKGDLEQIKALAQQENKPFFVSFTARWCTPCRQMEKTTYSDPDLAYYVSQYYLAGKVDVDDFDGYNYKIQYNIRLLPTLMIFSPEGKPIAKYEQSMSASTMKQILAKYNVPYKNNRVQVRPPQPVASVPQPSTYYRPTTTISRPSINTKPTTRPTRYYQPQANSRPSRPVATGEGLYRLSISEQVSSGYGIQLGMFEDYDNLLAEAERLDQLLRKDILVHVDRMNGKKVYKVLVGDFKSKERAILYRNNLMKKGLNGFIRDLSLMK